MSRRAASSALCAPVCHTWFPRTFRAAPRVTCVAGWWRGGPVDLALAPLPDDEVRGDDLHEVDDGVSDLLHVDHVVPADRPVIRLLPSAFRGEERLVGDDARPP